MAWRLGWRPRGRASSLTREELGELGWEVGKEPLGNLLFCGSACEVGPTGRPI